MARCLYDETLREAADCLNTYVERENDLIKLAGFNLRALIDKLKAGYTIEAPKEENLTPHLVDVSYVDDNFAVYVMGPGVEWDDLTDHEKRLVYETLKYELYKKRR